MQNPKFHSMWYNHVYFDENLHKSLNSLSLDKTTNVDKSVNKKSRVYLVLFRNLNKDKNKTIIYNYMTYHEMFNISLLIYLISKSNFISTNVYKEWNDFFTVIDNSIDLPPLLWEDLREDYISCNEYLKLYLQDQRNFNAMIDTPYAFTDFIKKTVALVEPQKIIPLVLSAFTKQYSEFFDTAFSNINYDYSFFNENSETMNINLLNNCLFVVKDLEKFLIDFNKALTSFNKELKKSSDISLNQGPQAWRGQINSMQNFLNLFDYDFRKSLYHQALYHKNVNFNIETLSQRNYSFENIHMNIGNVKW